MELLNLDNVMGNLKDDQSRLLFSILLTFPIGYLNNFFHGKEIRKIYGLFFGVLIQYFMYGEAIINLFICSFVCQIILIFCRRDKVGWITMIYVFSHLSALHIYRMITDYGGWSMDITTIMMTSLCKFTSFAFCYSDGEDIDKLSDHNKKHAIKEFTLLEYISYIHFYPSCIMGPFFEFSDFKDYIEEKNDYSDIPKMLALFTGLKRLFQALIFALIYLTLKPFIGINFYNENKGGKYVSNVLIFYSFLLQKYRYIIGFLFAESICVVSGLSYRKLKENSDFEKIKTINFAVTETTTSVTKYFQNWNISVHYWLKKYVHFRVYPNQDDYKDKNKRIKSKAVTFMISSFWHGFYPSYYIIFSHFPIAIMVEENFEYIKKHISKSKKLNIMLDIFFSFGFLTNAAFIIGILDSLHFANMIDFMAGLYFLPTIGLLLTLLISNYFIKCYRYKS